MSDMEIYRQLRGEALLPFPRVQFWETENPC